MFITANIISTFNVSTILPKNGKRNKRTVDSVNELTKNTKVKSYPGSLRSVRSSSKTFSSYLSNSLKDSNPITKFSFYTTTSLCKNPSIFERSRNYRSSRGTYYNKFNTNAPISKAQKAFFEKQLGRTDISDAQRKFFLKGLENGTKDNPKEDYPTEDNQPEENKDFLVKSVILITDINKKTCILCFSFFNHIGIY